MASETLDLSGLAVGLRKLGDAAPRDWTPLLRVVAQLLRSDAKTCFDQGRSPDGTPWKPLKKPSKRRGGPSAKPLRNTGVLMASISSRGTGSVERIGAASVTVGTNLDYAGYHQAGTRFIPARPFLGLSTGLVAKVERAAADYAVGQLKRVALR